MASQILVAVDGSRKNLEVLRILGALVKDHPECRLVLYHCVPELTTLLPGEVCVVDEVCNVSQEGLKKMGAAVMRESRKALSEGGFPGERVDERLNLGCTDPATEIIREADARGIATIAMGRRGLGQVETLLLGSISAKVAQYATGKAVWVVDTPVHEFGKVLLAVQGEKECTALTHHAATMIAPLGPTKFTFLHITPPMPPSFWDDGHILNPGEREDRDSVVKRWEDAQVRRVEATMTECRAELVKHGVPAGSIETKVVQAREGISRDLLEAIARERYGMVLIGRRSLDKKAPFLIGSHANKILQNCQNVVLALVG